MAVNSTAVSGRVRFTYNNADDRDLRINGISPTSSAMQVMQLLNGVQRIQRSNVAGAYLTVERDLEEV